MTSEQTERERALARFSRILQLPTVSALIAERGTRDAFQTLFDELPQLYPALWSAARIVAEPPWRLVIEVEGNDRSRDPILLMAHFDVVGVEHETLNDWEHPPFDGFMDADYVWGRGAIDDKSAFVALLEAMERLVVTGHRFARSVVLAFGGDEELSGAQGAGTIAARFGEEGRRFAYVLDEGGVVASGMLRTPSRPVALVGVAEKGFCNIVVHAAAEGGHASMPPRRTAVGEIAIATRLAERRPFRARLLPSIRRFFLSLARHARLPERLLYRNVRLLWPLFRRILGSRPATDALIRTTQAATVVTGSQAANVLAQSATLTINCRILPGETLATTLSHYQRLFRKLPVTVSLEQNGDNSEPVPETSIEHPGFKRIAELCAELIPEAIAAPYLVAGSTDSKWYRELTDAILRFVPVVLAPVDLARVHGTNERIGREAFFRLIEFYRRLVKEECTYE